MRAREFINESSNLESGVSNALPAAYAIPKLQNQDPYLQYRFGVALAQTKSSVGSEQEGEDVRHTMSSRSPWGENMVIVSYDPHIGDWIDAALKEVGLSPNDKKLLSTKSSDEPADTSKNSPVKAFKGYPR